MPQQDAKLISAFQAAEANKRVKAHLENCIQRSSKAIADMTVNMRTTAAAYRERIPDYQFDIRVFKALSRMIDRDFVLTYGDESDPMFEVAKIEAGLSHVDNGTLYRIGTSAHQQGRLYCTACDTDYDDATQRPIILTRLCPTCKDGIQHVHTSLASADVLEAGIDTVSQTTFVRIYTCDNPHCHHVDKYPIGTVKVLPDKPRIFEIKL